MSDSIDRQAAIDSLQNCRKYCVDPMDSYHIDIQDAEYQLSKVPSAEPETCAYWDRESNICALHRPSAQRWIPVTPKTLPKEVGDYIVMTHGGSVTKLLFMGNSEYWMQWAVAWMPLPEPYRPEGEEHG